MIHLVNHKIDQSNQFYVMRSEDKEKVFPMTQQV